MCFETIYTFKHSILSHTSLGLRIGLQTVRARAFCLSNRGALRVQKCAIWNELARVKLPLKEDNLQTEHFKHWSFLQQMQKVIAQNFRLSIFLGWQNVTLIKLLFTIFSSFTSLITVSLESKPFISQSFQ